MTVIDYNKETQKYKVYVSGELSPKHIEMLLRFKDESDLPLDSFFSPAVFSSNVVDNHDYQSFYDLKHEGFLESHYHAHKNLEMVRITDTGRIILKKLI